MIATWHWQFHVFHQEYMALECPSSDFPLTVFMTRVLTEAGLMGLEFRPQVKDGNWNTNIYIMVTIGNLYMGTNLGKLRYVFFLFFKKKNGIAKSAISVAMVSTCVKLNPLWLPWRNRGHMVRRCHGTMGCSLWSYRIVWDKTKTCL